MGEGDEDRPPLPLPGRALRAAGRALRLRCPECGTRGILRGWFGEPGACPRCGLEADRGEDDYFLGPLLLNLVITETAAAGLVAASVALTWPDTPWDALLAGGVALAVLLPAAGLPFARLLWLAVDLQIRPRGAED